MCLCRNTYTVLPFCHSDITVGFEHATYHLDEGETVSLCVLYVNDATHDRYADIATSIDFGGDADG